MIKIKKTVTVEFRTLDDLMNHNDFIGFEAEGGSRYMIVCYGPARGLAVNPQSTWATETDQKVVTEGYVVFGTKSELL